MRKTILLLALGAMVFSCTEQAKQGAVIKGTAQNLTNGLFVLGKPGGGRDTVRLDDKGNFTITLNELTKPGNYYILSENDYAPFYVAPGMKLVIRFDKKNFKNTLKFSGKGSDINTYLEAKSKNQGDPSGAWFKLEANDFRAKQDSMLAVSKALLASARKDEPNNEFWTNEEANVVFGWASLLNMFPSYHEYYAGVKGYKAPEDFYSFKKELNLNNAAYVNASEFQSYVSVAVRQETSDRIDKIRQADSTAKPDEQKIRLDVARELLTEPAVLTQFLYDAAVEGMQWQDIQEVQATIDLFREKCKDAAKLADFEKQYDAWKKLEKGQPAFEFSGRDMQGNTVKLSDFKGKYVYVDVWATWCGPCIGEIPYLDSLETDFEGKNIVFISFSVDEDHDAWMKFVPEKQLKGVQIIGEKAWESQLCKDYKIRGVPTFMFFDPDGKIISVKMTRPSDKETRETFLNLTGL